MHEIYDYTETVYDWNFCRWTGLAQLFGAIDSRTSHVHNV